MPIKILFMKIRLQFFIILLSLTFLNKEPKAQVLEKRKLKLDITSALTFSSKSYLPFWLTSNKYGLLDENRENLLFRPLLEFHNSLNKNWSYSIGFDLIVNSKIDKSSFQQLYGEVNYRSFTFWLGTREVDYYNHFNDLTSGSFLNSTNNKPYPTVAFGFKDYTDIPFTKGYLQFKGMFEQSILEKDRHINNALLHKKNFYLKSNQLPVNLILGFSHQVLFGGARAGIDYTPNMKDYMKILSGSSGSETSIGGEATNRLGDHRGVIDFGIEVDRLKYKISGYLQKPFDDGSGYRNFFSKNKDHFFGIGYESKIKGFVTGLLYENIYTKYQSGYGLPDPTNKYPNKESNQGYLFQGRDDYYNNYFYKTGSTYKGDVIGNPFFFTVNRASHYFNKVQDVYGDVVNNRIIAHHFALKGWFHKRIFYRFLYTFTNNFGTYAGLNQGRYEWESVNLNRKPYNDGETVYQFHKGLIQNYFLLESNYQFKNPHWSANAALGVDVGEMTNNVGLMLGVKWRGAFEF